MQDTANKAGDNLNKAGEQAKQAASDTADAASKKTSEVRSPLSISPSESKYPVIGFVVIIRVWWFDHASIKSCIRDAPSL